MSFRLIISTAALSSRPAEHVLQAIDEATSTETVLGQVYSSRQFTGEVRDNRFRLRLRTPPKLVVPVVLDGTVTETENGSRIDLVIRPRGEIVFVLVLFIAAMVSIALNEALADGAINTPDIFFVALAALFGAIP